MKPSIKNKKNPFLFDFGLSQEDPLTEQFILDVKPGDKILSLASAGDVPLSLLGMNENIDIKAVDISESQIKLCRLKLASAITLENPLNGRFLGYMEYDGIKREQIYHDIVRPVLKAEDARFWDENMYFIRNGIINAGRFERYIRKLKSVASIFIGRQNLLSLLEASDAEEQKRIFENQIATRKSLQLLFRIAFHPAIYRKRGLQDQALIHANKSTGERFYSKFRDFCTANPAKENYFLQYFLTGSCVTPSALPHYLRAENRTRIAANISRIDFQTISLQEALKEYPDGYFTGIHLSNLGDWSDEHQFADLLTLIRTRCNQGTKICYRYLQKNHLLSQGREDFVIDTEKSGIAERRDRFPFYGILQVTLATKG